MKRPVSRPVIAVGSGDPVWRGAGQWMDGAHPVAVPAALGFDDAAPASHKRGRPGAMTITPPGSGAEPTLWPYTEIRSLPGQARAGFGVLTRVRDDATRLIVDDDVLALIRTRAKRLHRAPKVRGRWTLAALGLAAVASVALMITVLVPTLADALADYLPPEGEAALGAATLGQIRTALDERGLGLPLPVCDAPEGAAALAAMTTLLTDVADLPAPLTVTVLDHPMINAFALPGGQVVLFAGLIDAAAAPDEVAAVLAHEIGHVAARDPTRIALRSAGSIGVLGLMFGDFAGGALVLLLTEQIIRADYTQAAEAAADAYATDLMVAARVPPSALANFFGRLAQDRNEAPAILAHFLSHPELDDRIGAARAVPAPDDMRASLSDADWIALQAICD